MGVMKDLTNVNGAGVAPNVDDVNRLKTIGTGSFGRVYLAEDVESKKYYALKRMQIQRVIAMRQINHVFAEKKILSSLTHPFIVKLLSTKSDGCDLFMLFEYIPGGELFTYLRNARRFNVSTGRFYAAEVVLALEYLHHRNVVYRDLKPENLMLTAKGHVKLTDFGFAKVIHDKTYTLCGTPEYLAPEVIDDKGYDKAVDWWSLGILIYEMLMGVTPFQGESIQEICAQIMSGRARFLKNMDIFAKDLIKRLLQIDQNKRIGNGEDGADEVKNHKWFIAINWEDLLELKIKPPIIPNLQSTGDTSNFDEYDEETDENDDVNDDGEEAHVKNQYEMDLFRDW